MADKEIAKSSDKVEKVDQGDRMSDETSKDSVISGDRKDHQSMHQEAASAGHTFDTFSDNNDDQSFKAIKPAAESFGIDFGDGVIETAKGKIEKDFNMTTAETTAFGGSDAEMMFDAAKEMPEGPEKEKAWKSIKATYSELATENNSSGDSDTGIFQGSGSGESDSSSYSIEKHDGQTVIKTGVSKQNLGHVFMKLPPDYQKKVIEAFQQGSKVGQESIHETADDILKRTTEGYIDAVKAPFDLLLLGGKGLLSILEFEKDLIFNPEEANRKAAIAGENIGYALVGGIKLFTGLSAYGAEINQSGDYTRPFRDLGNGLNNWYDSLTPGDQMHIMASISAGFGIGAAAGQLRNLAKPGAFVEFLEETAKAVPKNPEAQAKAVESIKKLIESFSKSKKPLTPALETGAVESGGQGLKSQMDKVSQALKDKFDELNHKMTAHKPEGSKGKWEAGKEVRKADVPSPATLDNIQTRDWYRARVAEIDGFELQMREAGKSSKEIFEKVHELRNKAKQQARDIMKDRLEAQKLDRKYPLLTREETLKKYGGDYEKAIEAAKRTNSDVNRRIEEARKRRESD